MDFYSSLATEVTRALLRLIGISVPDLYRLIRTVKRSEEDTDRQIREAVEALNNSSMLIHELESTLREREGRLAQLRDEYERISTLSTLTAKQGDAIASQLEHTLGKTQKRERIISIIIAIIVGLATGLAIFVFGVFASDWVKALPSRFW